MQWFEPVIIALDQLLQCLFMMKAIPGQTISARAGKAAKREKKWGCILCKILNVFDTNHCNGAIKNDIKRAQAVIDDLKDYIE